MTYFADSSLYAYSRCVHPALNVGWLDGEHAFETEQPSEQLLDALWQFIKAPVIQTRGFHECERCPRAPEFDERVREIKRRLRDPADPFNTTPYGELPWPEDARRRSVKARRDGEERLIGTAEIRVFGESGAVYAAPTLIYHYVSEHHYKPPAEFVRAALHGPRPTSDEYRALLQRHAIT